MPLIKQFAGATELNGQKVNKWVNVTKVYSRSSTYTFYTTSSEPIVPVQYVMMGYDSLLGSHYDKYIVEYTFFDDHTPLKESDFAVPEGESNPNVVKYSSFHWIQLTVL